MNVYVDYKSRLIRGVSRKSFPYVSPTNHFPEKKKLPFQINLNQENPIDRLTLIGTIKNVSRSLTQINML